MIFVRLVISLVSSTLLCAAVGSRSLAAQVYVVDAAGTVGSHFKDLPEAVAAVPDGATLRVRPGSYTGFVIDGKGLAIVGEGAVRVSLGALAWVIVPDTPIVVQRTAANQPVLLKGLTLTTNPSFLFDGRVEIRQAAGPVVLDSIVDAEPADVVVDRSANVILHRCSLTARPVPYASTSQPRLDIADSVCELSFCGIDGHDGPIGYPFAPHDGTPALRLLRSRCVFTTTTLRGGVGSPGCNVQGGPFRCWISPPGRGGLGVHADASTLVIRTSTIAGARGHNERMDVAGLVPAGDGGDGLVLRTGSRATALRSTIVGGVGGTPNGRSGMPFVVDATNTFVADPTAMPTSVELRGSHSRGGSADFVVLGAAMSPAVMLFSYRADIVPLEPIAFGSMLSAPALVLGPFTLSSIGELRGSIPLSTTWPLGETYFAQVLSLAPGTNAIWPSNRVVLHVNH